MAKAEKVLDLYFLTPEGIKVRAPKASDIVINEEGEEVLPPYVSVKKYIKGKPYPVKINETNTFSTSDGTYSKTLTSLVWANSDNNKFDVLFTSEEEKDEFINKMRADGAVVLGIDKPVEGEVDKNNIDHDRSPLLWTIQLERKVKKESVSAVKASKPVVW